MVTETRYLCISCCVKVAYYYLCFFFFAMQWVEGEGYALIMGNSALNTITALTCTWIVLLIKTRRRRRRKNPVSVLGMIIFGLVWFFLKKVTKPIFFFKKSKSVQNRSVSVWFCLEKNRFKPVWLSFFILARFFQFGSVFWFDSIYSGFFVLVWFGFFGFGLIKPNRTGYFFQNFNRFF